MGTRAVLSTGRGYDEAPPRTLAGGARAIANSIDRTRATAERAVRPRFFYGWIIVSAMGYVSAVAIFLGGVNLGLFIKPMGEALGISAAAFGWSQTVRALCGAATGPLLGRLMDRYGARYLLAGAAFIGGVGTILLGFVTDGWQVMVLFGIMGLVGMSGPAQLYTLVPISKWFIRRRSFAFSCLFLGLVSGPTLLLPANQIAIEALGWSATWVIIGLIAIVTIIPLSLLVIRREPEDMGLLPDGDEAPRALGLSSAPIPDTQGRYRAGREGSAAPLPRGAPAERSWTRNDAMRSGTFWRLGFAFAFTFFAGGGFVLFRIAHFVEKGMDPTIVAVGASADALMFGIFAFGGGILGERFPVRALALSGFGAMFVAIVLVILAESVATMIFANALWGSAAGVTNITQQIMWSSYFGRAHQGAIRGVVMPLTVTIGSVSGPLVGMLREASGTYTTGWSIAAALVLLGGILVAMSPAPKVPDDPESQADASGRVPERPLA